MVKFLLLIGVCAIIGGLVGAEHMGGAFSPTGAVIGGAGAGVILLSLGAYFHKKETSKKEEVPEEIKAIFGRMIQTVAAESVIPKDTRQQSIELFFRASEKLLSAQMFAISESLRAAFPLLMTNRQGAGYVFGFHDSILQRFRLRNDVNAAQDLMEESYRRLFGEQAGYALFQASLQNQGDAAFARGRIEGGEDFALYATEKQPPLGLNRILLTQV